jgi:RNase P subunit RPR2
MDDIERSEKAAEARRKKEAKAERLAEKVRFDARAKRGYCIRCHARGATHRIHIRSSKKAGVLSFSAWLCGDCGAGLSVYLSEVQAARREAERPAREAEMAERNRALAERQAEARARLDEQRAASGLPPLPATRPKKKAATRRKLKVV